MACPIVGYRLSSDPDRIHKAPQEVTVAAELSPPAPRSRRALRSSSYVSPSRRTGPPPKCQQFPIDIRLRTGRHGGPEALDEIALGAVIDGTTCLLGGVLEAGNRTQQRHKMIDLHGPYPWRPASRLRLRDYQCRNTFNTGIPSLRNPETRARLRARAPPRQGRLLSAFSAAQGALTAAVHE